MTTDALGGVWTYSTTLARGLASRGVGVVLATLGPRPSPAQRKSALSIPGLVLEESDFALEWADWPWADMRAAGDWLLELERRHDPDIVHLNSYGHAARSFRSPVVITAHGCACAWWRAVYRAQAPALYDRYRDLVRKGLQGAQIVIAPSVAAWDSIELEHGGHPTVYVVPHGLSPESFGREDKLPFVLCAAREWDEAKNLQLVDRAMPDLMWPVHVGDGLERPELLRWMQTASVFLHPAKYEPFGYTVLEAALSGCALLLADIPSLNEIWGPTALYFNPDSASELTQKANLLVEHPELRRGMAARAHERALELSVDQMVDAHLGIYREAWSKVTASSSLSR